MYDATRQRSARVRTVPHNHEYINVKTLANNIKLVIGSGLGLRLGIELVSFLYV